MLVDKVYSFSGGEAQHGCKMPGQLLYYCVNIADPLGLVSIGWGSRQSRIVDNIRMEIRIKQWNTETRTGRAGITRLALMKLTTVILTSCHLDPTTTTSTTTTTTTTTTITVVDGCLLRPDRNKRCR